AARVSGPHSSSASVPSFRDRRNRHCSLRFRQNVPPFPHSGDPLMPHRRRRRRHRVVVVAYDRVALFEMALAVEVFGLPRPELDVPWYDFSVCSVDPGPLRSTGAVRVATGSNLRTLETADTIIVPGWPDPA